jgi:hypothetical protein
VVPGDRQLLIGEEHDEVLVHEIAHGSHSTLVE